MSQTCPPDIFFFFLGKIATLYWSGWAQATLVWPIGTLGCSKLTIILALLQESMQEREWVFWPGNKQLLKHPRVELEQSLLLSVPVEARRDVQWSLQSIHFSAKLARCYRNALWPYLICPLTLQLFLGSVLHSCNCSKNRARGFVCPWVACIHSHAPVRLASEHACTQMPS